MLPQYIEINNKKYKINTDFRVALACLKAIDDEEIDDSSRMFAVVSLLLGADAEIDDYATALKKIDYYLKCGKKDKVVPDNTSNKKIMDFNFDKDYIFASFMSEYRINLHEIEYMHWWEFNALVQGLSEQSIFAKIINIRDMDINEYKDAKTRAKIKKAKDSVKLPDKEIKYNEDEKNLLNELGIKIQGLEE